MHVGRYADTEGLACGSVVYRSEHTVRAVRGSEGQGQEVPWRTSEERSAKAIGIA